MRDKIKFDLIYAQAVLSKKKRATIRVGERKYTDVVKIYVGERFAGKAKVVKQFPFRVKNLQDWMVRKEGMSKKELLRGLSRIYGNISNRVLTFVEFDLEPVYFAGVDGDNVFVVDGAGKKVVAKKVNGDELISFLKQFDPKAVAINCDKEEIYTHGELEFIGECDEAIELLRKLRSKLKGKIILTNSKSAKKHMRIKASGSFASSRIAALVAYLNFLGETEDISGIRIPKDL